MFLFSFIIKLLQSRIGSSLYCVHFFQKYTKKYGQSQDDYNKIDLKINDLYNSNR